MVELKPCPYCGSPAEMDSSDMADWVRCTGNECGAEGPALESAAASIAAWNRRAPVSAPTPGGERQSIDTPEFSDLIVKLLNADHAERNQQDNDYLAACRALIAHIDTKLQAARDDALFDARLVCDLKYEARVASGHPREASTARALSNEIGAMIGAAPAPGNTEMPGHDVEQQTSAQFSALGNIEEGENA